MYIKKFRKHSDVSGSARGDDDNDDDKLFCGIVDRQTAVSLISSQDHCQRFSQSQTFDTPRAGFESAQNLSSDFVE